MELFLTGSYLQVANYYITGGREFVVAKEVVNQRNGNILTGWEWINDDFVLFISKFDCMNKQLFLEGPYRWVYYLVRIYLSLTFVPNTF